MEGGEEKGKELIRKEWNAHEITISKTSFRKAGAYNPLSDMQFVEGAHGARSRTSAALRHACHERVPQRAGENVSASHGVVQKLHRCADRLLRRRQGGLSPRLSLSERHIEAP